MQFRILWCRLASGIWFSQKFLNGNYFVYFKIIFLQFSLLIYPLLVLRINYVSKLHLVLHYASASLRPNLQYITFWLLCTLLPRSIETVSSKAFKSTDLYSKICLFCTKNGTVNLTIKQRQFDSHEMRVCRTKFCHWWNESSEH